VDHLAVIAWERIMREMDEGEPSTIRRRLAAPSSLFKHLKRHNYVENNPVADVGTSRHQPEGRIDTGVFQGGRGPTA
jgi:site-specific recombinase XerD